MDPDPISIAGMSLGLIDILGRALDLSLLPLVVAILIVEIVFSLLLTVLVIALTVLVGLAMAVLWRSGTIEEANGTLLEPIIDAFILDRS